MQKIKKPCKKALSVFMAMLMVMTAWIFVAPTKAEAATAGKYDIRVTYKSDSNLEKNYGGTINKEYNDSFGITVKYKKNNGTGDEAQTYFNLKGKNKSGTSTATISGFPTLLYVYFDDDRAAVVGGTGTVHCTKLEVKGTDQTKWTTLWSGDLQIKSVFNPYAISVDSSGTVKNNYSTFGSDSDCKAISNSGGWTDKFPAASSITISGDSSVTMPKTDAGNKEMQFSGTVYDQYDVAWHEDPTFYVPVKEPTDLASVKDDTSSGMSGMTAAGKLTITPSAQVAGTTNSRDVWIAAKRGNAWAKKKIVMTDPKYQVTFNNYDDELIVTRNVYYGCAATAPSDPTRGYDENYHYTFSKWDTAFDNITTDTTVTAVYNSVAHAYSKSVKTPASCTGIGTSLYTCSCGHSYTADDIPANGHNYKGTVTNPTCTERGYTTNVCSVCGDTYIDNYVEPLGHDYVLDHIITDSTCTAEGTQLMKCSRCSVTIEEAIPEKGHDFSSDYTIDSSATCTEAGSKSRHCSRCDAITDVTVISPMGHDESGEWITDKAATCTEAGTRHKDCKVCNETCVTETINPLGHAWKTEYTVDKEPSCTECGSESIHCSRCDAKKDERQIGKLDHTPGEWIIDSNPTCTVDGSKHQICSVCKGTIATDTIPATNHPNKVKHDKIPATCMKKGTIEYWSCDDCGKNFSDEACTIEKTDLSIPVDSSNHNWDEPTYSWSTDGKNCTAERVCTRSSSHKETEEAKISSSEKIAPSCTVMGTTTYTATFDNAAFTLQINDVADIPATNHPNKKHHEKTASTCNENGTIEYWSCPDCRKNFSNEACTDEVEDLSAPLDDSNHSWGEPTYSWSTDGKTCTAERVCIRNSNHKETEKAKISPSEKIAPTCTAMGTTTYTATFKNTAFKAQTNDVVDIPATGHPNKKFIPRVSASCISDGVLAHWSCPDCGRNFSDEACKIELDNVIISIDGDAHKLGKAEYNWNADYSACTATRICDLDSNHVIEIKATVTKNVLIQADCTQTGRVTSVAVFNADGCETQTVTKDTPITDHNLQAIAEVAATCQGTGVMAHDKCSVCGKKFIDGVEKTEVELRISKKQHVYGDAEYDESNPNNHRAVCTLCGKDVKTGACTYDSKITTPATCTTDEITTYTCSVCGHAYTKITDNAWGHDFEVKANNDSTHTMTCKRDGCGIVIVADCVYSDWSVTVDETCTQPGVKERSCQDCGYTEQGVVPVHAHTIEDVDLDPAGCDKIGIKAHKVCSECHQNFIDGAIVDSSELIIPKLGHDIKWSVDKEATCTEKGVERASCSRCDYSDTKKTPALGHDMGEWTVIKQPSCGINGREERYCSRCDKIDARAIAALKHESSKIVGKIEATCTRSGYSGDVYCGKCGVFVKKGEVVAPVPHSGTIANCCEKAKCKWCGTEYGELDPTVHKSPVKLPAIEATCTEDGATEGLVCHACGVTVVEQQIIPAKGHDDPDHSGVCDDCHEDYANNSADGCICHKNNMFSKIIRFVCTILSKIVQKRITCCDDMIYYSVK